jgi:hypothetical protein
MYNKKVLIESLKKLGSAKAPTQKKDIIMNSVRGQWDNPGDITQVPGSKITMGPDPLTGKSLTQPLLGVGSNGQRQMMYPGKDYDFGDAEYVTEYPQMRSGGNKQNHVVVKPSKIKGADKGLFSNQSFRKNQLVGLAHKDGQPVGHIGNMHNHSDEPNMYSIKKGNQRYVYAKYDIQPGEELTTDYRQQPELEQPEDFMKNGGMTPTFKKGGGPGDRWLASLVKQGTRSNNLLTYPVKLAGERIARLTAAQSRTKQEILDALLGVNKGYEAKYFGEGKITNAEREKYGFGKRDLIANYFRGIDTGFEPTNYDFDTDAGLEALINEYGPLKAYLMNSQVQHEEPLHARDLLYHRFDKSMPHSEYDYPNMMINDPNISDNWNYSFHNYDADKTKENFHKLFDLYGKEIIPFDIQPDTSKKPPLFSFDYSPVNPIDNVAGHMAFLQRTPKNEFQLTTRDSWGFFPKNYDSKWNMSDKFKQRQTQLMDAFGKPFILTQNNPITFKKGGVHKTKNKNSRSYSRSLDATNKFFAENYLFEKPSSRKNKIYDPHAKYYQDGGNIDAMNAMMKARLAYANEFGNPAAKRMINLPDNPYQFDNGDTGTHYMASMDNYAVPQIQDENGQLMLGDYGPESDEAIRFDSDEDANYFAEHYKDVAPGFINAKLNSKEIQEYAKGGYIIEDISVPELDKAQKGKTVKPYYTSDREDYDYHVAMKEDSLAKHNSWNDYAKKFPRQFGPEAKWDNGVKVGNKAKIITSVVPFKGLNKQEQQLQLQEKKRRQIEAEFEKSIDGRPHINEPIAYSRSIVGRPTRYLTHTFGPNTYEGWEQNDMAFPLFAKPVQEVIFRAKPELKPKPKPVDKKPVIHNIIQEPINKPNVSIYKDKENLITNSDVVPKGYERVGKIFNANIDPKTSKTTEKEEFIYRPLPTRLNSMSFPEVKRPEQQIIPAAPYVKPVHYAGPRHGTWSDGSTGQFPQGLNTSDWERKTLKYQQQQRGTKPVVIRRQGGELNRTQEGGEQTVTDTDKDYYTRMANSPLFKERYARMVGKPIDQVGEEAEAYRQQILNNIETVKINDVGVYPVGDEGQNPENLGEYHSFADLAPVQKYIDTITNRRTKKAAQMELDFAKDFNNINSHNVFLYDNDPWTRTHELSHASVKGNINDKNVNAYPFKDMSNYPELGKYYEGRKEYLTSPDEQKARIDVARKYLESKKLYDPINEPFTEQHYRMLSNELLKDLQKTKQELPIDIDEIKTPYDKETIMKMFNNFVEKEPNQNSNLVKAEQGGEMEYELGDEIDEDTKRKLEELGLGYTFEII